MNRYGLPYGESPYQPDMISEDFKGLAFSLLRPEDFRGMQGRI
jgi:hypothetical protein